MRPCMANKSGPKSNKIILNEVNNIVTDDTDIYETFKKYFESIGDGFGFPVMS